MPHSHNIIDKDNHFIIDPITRRILPETHEKNKLVEGDHNSEKYTFEIPKSIEGHDMTQCNVIQIHYINVSADKKKNVKDIYEVDDLEIMNGKEDKLAFTWVIKEPATRYNGLLSFAITFECTTNDMIDYAWHTEIYTGITIGKGMNNGITIISEYSDILEKWKEELFAVDGRIETVARQALEDIENAKNETLSSIAQHGTVQVSNEEPTNPNVDLYINPDETVTISVPEIKDDSISDEDTWSSTKINKETAKLKEDLTTLRDDYSTDIESLEQNSAPPIILTATGESIVLEDSADRRVQGLRIFGKTTQVQTNGYQLFNASKIKSKTTGGATVTNNGDGSFTVSGSGNLTETFSAYYELSHEETIQILKAGRISVANNEAYPSLCAYLYYDNYRKYYNLITDTIKYTDITDEMLSHPDCVLRCYMYGYTGKAIKPGTIKPMLYQTGDGTWEHYSGGRPSPASDNPQHPKFDGANGEIKVFVHSTQLFNASKIKSKTTGGATVTNNGDGSFTVSGSGNLTETMSIRYTLSKSEIESILKPGIIYLKNGLNDGIYFEVEFITPSKAYYLRSKPNFNITDEIFNNLTSVNFNIYGLSGVTIPNKTFKPMVYQDGDGTWEPYKQPQTLTLQTPNGLPGIPVSANGNYTDSTGQQWISDEIDLKRGMYKQVVNMELVKITETTNIKLEPDNRVAIYNILKGTSKNGTVKSIITHGKYSTWANGSGTWCVSVKHVYWKPKEVLSEKDAKEKLIEMANGDIPLAVLYQLETPIETSLSEEIIQAFKTLRTYYSNTVVTNDADTGMELEYIADTQKYIDNKFAEMNKAVVATQKALL